MAGDEIVWMTGLLDLFPLHVSFSTIVPVNSSLNDSEITSDEGMELTLIAIEAVQMRPITCEDWPNMSVSRDITESSGMMKYLEVLWSRGRLLGTILPFTISISVFRLWSITGMSRVFVRIWFLQLEEEFDSGESVVTNVESSADILVFRFTSELVSPTSFSRLTSLMAVQYSSANDEEYFSFSFLEASWVRSCFRSSASWSSTVA